MWGRKNPSCFSRYGGSIIDDVLDAALTPRLIQPTTFGEINGTVTNRNQCGNRFMYQHAIKAKNEMKELHRQLYRLLKQEE